MSLELSQLHRLMLRHDESVQICTLEDQVMKLIRWRLPYVYLHHKYCLKILTDHPDITPFDLLRLPIAVMKGELILEPNKRVLDACYNDPENGNAYIAVLKRAVATEDHEIWISSFYRLEDRKLKKLRRSGQIIRDHMKS
jgi:DNA gyrase inhibitor GyrI